MPPFYRVPSYQIGRLVKSIPLLIVQSLLGAAKYKNVTNVPWNS